MTADAAEEVRISFGLEPGDAGEVVRWHGLLYHREYGFDHTFEAYVAEPLAEFIRRGSDREGIWIARGQGEFMGSAAVVQAGPDEAQLRWLILRPQVRGRGLGRKLASAALTFARQKDYGRLSLWTLSILTRSDRLVPEPGVRPD